eukprot:CAMPEP_0182853628 /NCGR_PEP_ID=MMETSP0034_2-20130328/802_1 /TAXON_ID=156128 /ORGANISM="Nephroselmis pyriformis, Strain CCMP717" /LENGTH=90 /DNA_ID=CAMNT_0024984407 /DNA_START=82 /DNA_END=355 /DNA_ORIENTATION=+
MNLQTNVDNLCYSPDGQILAIASRMKRDALRLVHVPSYTVFSNWPSSKTPIQFVSAMAFARGAATSPSAMPAGGCCCTASTTTAQSSRGV